MPADKPATNPVRKCSAITVVVATRTSRYARRGPYRSGKAIRDALAGQRDGDG